MTLNGRDFVAKRGIVNGKGEYVAVVGETCEHVDPSALEGHLAGGDIEAIDRGPAPAATTESEDA